MESNTLEWTAPIEHIHGNWPEKFRSYTDGHMITVNLVLRKRFLCLKTYQATRKRFYILKYKINKMPCFAWHFINYKLLFFILYYERKFKSYKRKFNPEEIDQMKKIKTLSFDDFRSRPSSENLESLLVLQICVQKH
jgi:hypothetical protein